MSSYLSDPFTATSLAELSVRRLGERTCIINVGTDLRHVELPVVDEAVREVFPDAQQSLGMDRDPDGEQADAHGRRHLQRPPPAREWVDVHARPQQVDVVGDVVGALAEQGQRPPRPHQPGDHPLHVLLVEASDEALHVLVLLARLAFEQAATYEAKSDDYSKALEDASRQFGELVGALAPAFVKTHLLVRLAVLHGPVAGHCRVACLAVFILEGDDPSEKRLLGTAFCGNAGRCDGCRQPAEGEEAARLKRAQRRARTEARGCLWSNAARTAPASDLCTSPGAIALTATGWPSAAAWRDTAAGVATTVAATCGTP